MLETLINAEGLLDTLARLVDNTFEGDLRYTVTSDTIQFRDIPQHKVAYIQGLADALQALNNSETRFTYYYDVAVNRFTVTES